MRPVSKSQHALARRQAAYRRGHSGERLAVLRLMLSGYRVLARRYKTKVGEIDLVVRRGKIVAFVEVKRRHNLAAGLEAVTPASRTRIRRAAELYLARNLHLAEHGLRFDIIVVTPWSWPRHITDAWRDF